METEGDTERKKQGAVSLQLIPLQVLHQGQRCLLHDAGPPVLGGVGSDELPSFPFVSGVVLNFSLESHSHSP